MSAYEGDERLKVSHPLSTYTDYFYQVFPYYLSIGMTYEQFWESDPTLTIYYRKAEELKNKHRNQDLWLQGMYFYEAMCDASPLLQAFAKKGTKPHPYATSPYPLTETDRRYEAEEKQRKLSEKGKKFMEAIMSQNNKKFETKK